MYRGIRVSKFKIWDRVRITVIQNVQYSGVFELPAPHLVVAGGVAQAICQSRYGCHGYKAEVSEPLHDFFYCYVKYED